MNTEEISTELIVSEDVLEPAYENANTEDSFKDVFTKKRLIIAGILLLIGILSASLLGNIASDPVNYAGFNSTLDEKKVNVMGLAATTAAASAAVSIIPNGAGEPIANKLIDFSTYLMVILAVIYLEKFLMTTLGMITFRFLIPIAIAMFIVALFSKQGSKLKANLTQLGTKLATFGLALALVVPASVAITDNIDASFEANLQAANQIAQEATDEINNAVDESTEGEEEEKGWFDGVVSTVKNGFTAIADGVKNALDSLANTLNNMIDTIAVMIVTSCLIPLIVLVIFFQLAKMISGIDFGGAGSLMSKASSSGRSAFSAVKRTVKKSK